jgi:hypothetical protein
MFGSPRKKATSLDETIYSSSSSTLNFREKLDSMSTVEVLEVVRKLRETAY